MRRRGPAEQYAPGARSGDAPSAAHTGGQRTAQRPWPELGWATVAGRQPSVAVVVAALAVAYFATLTIYGVATQGVFHPAPSTLYAPAGVLALAWVIRRWRVLAPWAPLVLVVIAYSALRDLGPGLATRAEVLTPIRVDRFLGGGEIPTIRLQGMAMPGKGVIEALVTLGYLQHFAAPVVAAVMLWRVDRARQRWFCAALVVLSLVGFASYLVFPAAPPWWASEHGFVEPIERTIHATLGQILPAGFVSFLWSAGESDTVGAFPSLHAAWPLLISIALWPLANRRWRAALVAYPLWVGFSLIYSGEHYLGDVVVGYVYAVVAAWVVSQAWRTDTLRLVMATRSERAP